MVRQEADEGKRLSIVPDREAMEGQCIGFKSMDSKQEGGHKMDKMLMDCLWVLFGIPAVITVVAGIIWGTISWLER